ncbi:MAG: nucleoside 2-deoxyribosyltransferase [Candidatus Woesearchaeota archaeon]|nr:nucleoside 2-deoxyribosyltransferase [Candidatus Woesearchaeota archaeon]
MKIYFAGSIRGGRHDVDLYLQMIDHLKQHGEVLTEHVGDKNLKVFDEDGITDGHIHDRDLKWILSSDILIAEVSTPSLGVGYEIGRAVENNKRVLCLYHPQAVKMVSAMIAGCPKITLAEYRDIDEAKKIIDKFLK